ncbi:DUF2188 domain-containing protein [Saccharopolyspora sp. NPDC050642]|uniref:DUF2188 domain-containing protein n=1 Tax=Saccharopolyspora sp. NPDC050642 TaxID=3157099 RepID=UPI0034018249
MIRRRVPPPKTKRSRRRTRNVRDGGGELVIHGTDGTIRDKRTVPPGHDPYPPPG